jgi:hypothetical protein
MIVCWFFAVSYRSAYVFWRLVGWLGSILLLLLAFDCCLCADSGSYLGRSIELRFTRSPNVISAICGLFGSRSFGIFVHSPSIWECYDAVSPVMRVRVLMLAVLTVSAGAGVCCLVPQL